MRLNSFDHKTQLDERRALFSECFPETNGLSASSEEHYLWKFHGAPNTPHSLEYGAYDADDLIGYYAAIPFPYRYGNTNFTAAMVCDVMTGIKARGKGVFTQLGVFSTDAFKNHGFELATGYPIRPEVIPGHLKAGWKKMFQLPLYIKLLNTQSLLRRRKLGFLSPVANILLGVFNLPQSLVGRTKHFSITVYPSAQLEAIPGLEVFLEQWQSEQVIALRKNLDFLSWRLRAPERTYEIFVATRGEAIVGYAVTTRTIKEGVPSMAILDLCCLTGHEACVPLLLRSITCTAKRSNMEALLLMFSKYSAKRYHLLRYGFLRSPFAFWLITKYFGDHIPAEVLYRQESWHLGWIDSDDL